MSSSDTTVTVERFGPLYPFLAEIFPTHRTILGKLDVPRLGKDLGLSHEAVYKWLRKPAGARSLTPQNAERILELALADDNADALLVAEKPRPTIRDFDQFVYGTT